MHMGASRNISDARIEDMSQESQAMIGLQAGSNKGASQAGNLFEWECQRQLTITSPSI